MSKPTHYRAVYFDDKLNRLFKGHWYKLRDDPKKDFLLNQHILQNITENEHDLIDIELTATPHQYPN